MSAAADTGGGGARPAPAFSPGAVLALVIVGIVAFAGLAVLTAFAPDLRTGQDGRGHALSKSAIGFAGAPILMKALDQHVVVSRVRPHAAGDAAIVLTPDETMQASVLNPFAEAGTLVIVLPKWNVARDPIRPGFVRKVGAIPGGAHYSKLLEDWSKATTTAVRKGVTQPVLYGVEGGPFRPQDMLSLGKVDSLQTVSGEGWAPALVDEQGRTVLAYSKKHRNVWLLAEPDLLNNQGLKTFENARAGAAILDMATFNGELPLIFDVTLNGYERGRGLWRLMLEPPWLAATLIGATAGVLMGLHALARFGQPHRRGRAIALGARALVDNSAELVRAARKEHELAPAYAALTRMLVARAAGGHALEERWLDDLAARRGAAQPAELAAEAEGAKTRDDLLSVAKRIYEWRGEMTRERR
jgi:hypothetical protein